MSNARIGRGDGSGSGRKVRSLRELPQGLRPGRDLWPQLSTRLDRRPFSRTLLRWRLWDVRAAAAVGLTVTASAAALVIWIHGNHTPAAQLISIHRSTPVLPQSSDADEARRHDAIIRALRARLAGLPPGSRQQVLSDLNLIEQSMRDVRTALGRDPGNALLLELLTETYQDEQQLLATVQDADVWTRQAGGGKGST